jgi:hypothetical protein
MKPKPHKPQLGIDVTGLPAEAVQAVETVVSLLRSRPRPNRRTRAPLPSQLLGLFRDEAELLDNIVEKAMIARETQTLRLPHE